MSSPAATTDTQIDDPEMGSTWFYAFVGIILFVAFCLAVSVLYFGVQRNFEQERVIDERPAFSTQLRTQQKQVLAQYGTYSEDVDGKPAERVRIPIDRALEIMSKQGK